MILLRDVRDDTPGEAHLLGGLTPNAIQWLAVDGPPALEVGERRHRNTSSAPRRCRRQLADKRLDVLLRDPAARGAPMHLSQIHAQLAGQAARGWPGRDRFLADRRRGRLRRWPMPAVTFRWSGR